MRFYGLLFALLITWSATAQVEMRLAPRESRLYIRGTSSLHSWQCRAEQTSGQLTATYSNTGIDQIKSLNLGIIVASIKSIGDKGEYYDKNMDKNVYKALKADNHNTILFTVTSVSKKGTNNKGAVMEATGILKVAGVSREITVPATCIQNTKGLILEGKVPLKMTDYNVEPPTAIFGTIKTGNEIVIDFKLVYHLLSLGK